MIVNVVPLQSIPIVGPGPLPPPRPLLPLGPPPDATEVEYDSDPVEDSDTSAEVRDDDYDDTPIRRRRKSGGVSKVGLILVGVMGLAAIIAIGVAVNRHRQNQANQAAASQATQKESQKEKASQETKKDAQKKTTEPRPQERNSSDESYETRSQYSGSSRQSDEFMPIICYLVVIFAYLLFVIFPAIWVIKDCRNRSIENGVLWMLLIVPLNLVALLIYMASRPHGSLIRCENCGNKRLAYVGICPHCHQPVQSRGRVA